MIFLLSATNSVGTKGNVSNLELNQVTDLSIHLQRQVNGMMYYKATLNVMMIQVVNANQAVHMNLILVHVANIIINLNMNFQKQYVQHMRIVKLT